MATSITTNTVTVPVDLLKALQDGVDQVIAALAGLESQPDAAAESGDTNTSFSDRIRAAAGR
jgi:hypothetical protein